MILIHTYNEDGLVNTYMFDSLYKALEFQKGLISEHEILYVDEEFNVAPITA